MQTVLYDGSFPGFMSAVFSVYEYKLKEPCICTSEHFTGDIFNPPQTICTNQEHHERVWKGLSQRLSRNGLQKIYQAFLSEQKDIENLLLQYIQYVFSSPVSVEYNYAHPSVLAVSQTVKKVHREKHRMEAFVRFQKTKEDLYFAVVDPDFNVLPLIAPHFVKRYADQHWLIYDIHRKYGIHFNGKICSEVTIIFAEAANDISNRLIYTEEEEIFQKLWATYFSSVNIAARKNTRLHIQHVPRRYWKYLTEKQVNISNEKKSKPLQ